MENKRRKSIIWKMEKSKLIEITEESTSIAEILRKLGYEKHLTSRWYIILKKRLDQDEIDYTHIKLGAGSNLNRKFDCTAYTKEEVLEKLNIPKLLHSADKQRIIKFNLVPHTNCAICDINRSWNGIELRLQLDHIDGNPTNNTPTNLRFLCPNCHSQTDTFCYGVKQRTKCIDCGIRINKISTRCIRCSNKITGEKIKKFEISDEELTKLVCYDRVPFTTIGKMFGVSDNAIRKRCKNIGIDSKTRKLI